MKLSKKLLAFLLCLAMVFSIIPVVGAEEVLPLATEDEVVIYYTNDVHTYINKDLSYDNIADLKTQTEAVAADVLLVDAGDHIQGTAYGSMDKGETIVELMEAAGYDVATLGNHEFDYGMDRALEVATMGDVQYVSCNFYNEEDGVVGQNVLPSYYLYSTDQLSIAIIGVTTPESFTKSTPAYFQDDEGNYIYGIAGGEDGSELYEAVQAAIDEVAGEVDLVIALAHLGDDVASQPWTSEELIANTTGLDAVIDGHSHSTVPMKEVEDKDGNTVILTQTGEYFNAIGKMTINLNDLSISTELITEWTGSDENVAAIKDAWITEIEDQLGEVIGASDVDLVIYDEDGSRLIRSQETNLGDFCADALYYLFDSMDMDVDVAIMNGGGIRANAAAGEISYNTCKTVHTFGNVACLQTITGQQLLDALEWGAQKVGVGESGGFLQVSGITYEIHSYIPSTVQMDEKGVWTGGPTGEYRVKNVKILQDGEYVDLDLEAEYNLAGYNYTLRDLGDGFAMFDGAVNVLDYVSEDYMVLANYVESFPVDEETGLPTIGADSIYADPYGEGRIQIVANDPVEYAAEDEVVIYYTNDVHTYIDKELSYDSIAYLKTQTGYDAADVLLVDAGDHVQGTAYGSMDKGETIIELMNAAGYDLATLGNHEFDYGMDGTMNVIDWADYPYVSCNFYNEKDGVVGETVLDAYQVFELGGLKVAFIGVTTPESFTKSTPAYFQDENGNYIYGIAGGEDGSNLYETVQAAIDAASQEADIVIALAHLGDDTASQPWTSEELIANTTGLDALIDGHSHSTVEYKEVKDAEGNTVVLTQTGEYFNAIGKMTIAADGSIVTELVTEVNGSDASVAAIKNEWIADIDEQLGEVIGYAEVTFDNYDAEGKRLVRKVETNTGDFAADALYYLFEDMGLDVDVAIMNGGGVRNKAITGELSYKTMKDIHTFGNVACLQTITGQQLLDALEWGAQKVGVGESGGFLQVSGITYEIHSYIPSTVQMDEKGVWTGGPTGEYRVKNVKILQDGEYVDLDLEASYNLAGYNYTLRDLGDGFAMFDGAVNVLDYVMEDYMVLANYVESFPVNEETGLPTITADNSPYGDVYGEGRITLVTEKPADEPEHTHVYPEYWIVVKDPSSTEEGLAEHYCECGEKETMVLEKLVNRFTDVKEGEFYFEPVLWGDFWGITTGATETTFEPDVSCTRAQIVTFLWRACGEPEPETAKNPFTDVVETEYYYKAVLWAYENGITTGVTETSFAPNLPCTRAQAVAFLYRAAADDKAEGENPFADVSEKAYYYDAVLWAVENDVTNGLAADTFGPSVSCTRGQIMTFLYRLLHT